MAESISPSCTPMYLSPMARRKMQCFVYARLPFYAAIHYITASCQAPCRSYYRRHPQWARSFLPSERAPCRFPVGMSQRDTSYSAPFDTDMTLIAERKLNAHGIGIILGDCIQSFEKQADGTLVVHSQKGKTLPADFVIVSFEIRPDTDFLNESGITLGNRGTHAGQRISPDKYTRHLA